MNHSTIRTALTTPVPPPASDNPLLAYTRASERVAAALAELHAVTAAMRDSLPPPASGIRTLVPTAGVAPDPNPVPATAAVLRAVGLTARPSGRY